MHNLYINHVEYVVIGSRADSSEKKYYIKFGPSVDISVLKQLIVMQQSLY